MTSTVSISNQSITFDVNLVYCGFENSPTHDYRPHTQDSYVIQYVICGEGFYTLENRTYKIKKGDMFLIPLNHVCHYWADKTNPYQYYLGSSVSEILSCAGFSVANPIISYTDPKLEQIFATILKHFSTDSCTSFTLAHAAFINLFACLFEKVDINNILSKNSKAEYVQKAKAFIQNNFS